MEWLKGKKTYIFSAITLFVAGLLQFDVIEIKTYTSIMALLAPFGVASLRAGMTNAQTEKKSLV